MSRTLQIAPAHEDPATFSFSSNSREPLSDWIEHCGYPLNMRCGGRGICKGCTVEIETGEGTISLKSCQTRMDALPEDLVAVHIPTPSRRDQSLHGVSAFEILADHNPLRRPGIGLSLDIGTTTLAGALWDFVSGKNLAEGSVANAQRRFGDNVLARISFAEENPDGLQRLHQALVVDSIEPLLGDLLKKAGVSADSITQANAVGNPTMLHTLAMEPLGGFARYPFRPVFLGERRLAPETIHLQCPLDLLPGLAPFVGSDVVAGAIAAAMPDAEPPVLLIDFGTNGEILLKHSGGYLATATAAGPAFEGGRLACGAPAAKGVISCLKRKSAQWSWELVGGGQGRPLGLSGAAYVDFIALGCQEGWIGTSGRFDRSHPAVDVAETSETVVRLAPGLHVSEADVAELMQAKAAIAGGVATLLELAGCTKDDLKALFVAGGFGYHLNPAHARIVGLFPNIAPEKIRLIGNSALGGASLLLHEDHKPGLQDILTHTTPVELNQVSTFEDHFTDALMIPGE